MPRPNRPPIFPTTYSSGQSKLFDGSFASAFKAERYWRLAFLTYPAFFLTPPFERILAPAAEIAEAAALILLNADFSARLVVGPALYVDARSPAMEAMTAAFQTYLDFVEANLRSQPWNGYLHLLWKSRVGPGASP